MSASEMVYFSLMRVPPSPYNMAFGNSIVSLTQSTGSSLEILSSPAFSEPGEEAKQLTPSKPEGHSTSTLQINYLLTHATMYHS